MILTRKTQNHTINEKNNSIMLVEKIKPESILPNYMHEIIPYAQEISDTINALYCLDKLSLDQTIYSCEHLLKKRCSELIIKISDRLRDKSTSTALNYKAKSITATNSKTWLKLAYRFSESELILLCGKISTWVAKSNERKYSFVLAVPNNDLSSYIDKNFSCLGRFEYEFQKVTGINDLNISNPCDFQVANLAFCSGEANTFPKHFSYFLPEDEGVKHYKNKKTIVFSNIYLNRFLETTKLIGQLCIKDFTTSQNNQFIIEVLLFWMRGHDIGHFCKTEETDYKKMRAIGYFNSMSAQELIADCFGYYFSMHSRFNPTYENSKPLVINMLLAELLRYASREINQNPDANSSTVILSYLIENQYLKYNKETIQLSYNINKLENGIESLLKAFPKLYFFTDENKLSSFLNHYLKVSKKNGIKDLICKIRENKMKIPTSEFYDIQSQSE